MRTFYPAITSRGYWRQVGRYDSEPGLLWAIRITSFNSLAPSSRVPRAVSRATGRAAVRVQRNAARPLYTMRETMGERDSEAMKKRRSYFFPLLLRLEWPRSQVAMASRVMPPFATPVTNSTLSDAGLSTSR